LFSLKFITILKIKNKKTERRSKVTRTGSNFVGRPWIYINIYEEKLPNELVTLEKRK
jgi:hypothetical protein